MVNKPLLILALLFFLVPVAFAGSMPDMQEGQWEITVEMEMPGMPVKMPPSTVTQCITKDDLIPQSEQPGQQCTQKDVTVKGDTVSWTVECDTAGGKMTGKGKATYNKDKMHGDMTTESQGMKVITHFKGHRTGECK